MRTCDLTTQLDHIRVRHGVHCAGDPACGFGNTAMVLAEQRMIPRASSPRVARGVGGAHAGLSAEDAAVARAAVTRIRILKAITGFPMAMEGRARARISVRLATSPPPPATPGAMNPCRTSSRLGEACTDLLPWSNSFMIAGPSGAADAHACHFIKSGSWIRMPRGPAGVCAQWRAPLPLRKPLSTPPDAPWRRAGCRPYLRPLLREAQKE